MLRPALVSAKDLIPVQILGTNYSVQVSDRSNLIILITKIIAVNAKDYVVYS